MLLSFFSERKVCRVSQTVCMQCSAWSQCHSQLVRLKGPTLVQILRWFDLMERIASCERAHNLSQEISKCWPGLNCALSAIGDQQVVRGAYERVSKRSLAQRAATTCRRLWLTVTILPQTPGGWWKNSEGTNAVSADHLDCCDSASTILPCHFRQPSWSVPRSMSQPCVCRSVE
jgi:hypothetical protein